VKLWIGGAKSEPVCQLFAFDLNGIVGKPAVDYQVHAGESSVKKPVLVVTTRFVKPVEDRIGSEFEVRRKADGTPFQQSELLAAAEGADALFVTPFDRLDADFFRRVSSSVKVISTYSVGVDHIDLEAAAQRHIAIGYTPTAVTNATADVAMLLLLGASRRGLKRKSWSDPGSGRYHVAERS
jgi:lactate dehydrogenase-like 2-hydroxyacid dehydrogenase